MHAGAKILLTTEEYVLSLVAAAHVSNYISEGIANTHMHQISQSSIVKLAMYVQPYCSLMRGIKLLPCAHVQGD